MRSGRRWATAGALAGLWAFGHEAAAQTDPGVLEATRRNLSQEAIQARAAGDHERALDLAQRAGQLGMTTSLRRFIAEEQAELGQTGPAMGSAERCVAEAQRDRGPGAQAHGEACRALTVTLEPQVGRLEVRVASPPPSTRVTVDGEPLPESAWGAARVVTPGRVRVTATATGHRLFVREVDVDAGQSVPLVVSLEPALPEPAPPPPAVDAPAPERRPRVDPATLNRQMIHGDDLRSSRGGRVGVGPFVLFGAGAVSMGLAAVFYVVRNTALDDSNAQCDASGCPESARPDHDRAVVFNTLTNVALGVGAAAIVGGIVWFVLAPRTPTRRAPRASLMVAPSAGGAVFGLTGSL
ncbi:MAG: hypothetical protein R3A52_08200 [Polyangiales bacterium]